jgi:hypothetical protein
MFFQTKLTITSPNASLIGTHQSTGFSRKTLAAIIPKERWKWIKLHTSRICRREF